MSEPFSDSSFRSGDQSTTTTSNAAAGITRGGARHHHARTALPCLEVIPGRSLGPFLLGTPLHSVMRYLQSGAAASEGRGPGQLAVGQTRDQRHRIVIEQWSTTLTFHPRTQRLAAVEVSNLSAVEITHREGLLCGRGATPTFVRLYDVLGPTFVGTTDPKTGRYVLSYPGLDAVFVVPEEYRDELTGGEHPMAFNDGTTPVALSLVVCENVPDTAVAPVVAPFVQPWSTVDVDWGVGIRFRPAAPGLSDAYPESTSIRFGDTLQDVLATLGPPETLMPKDDDRLTIHQGMMGAQYEGHCYGAGGKKSLRPGLLCAGYPHYGLDLIFGALDASLRKICLYSGCARHEAWLRYATCWFDIPVDTAAATAARWLGAVAGTTTGGDDGSSSKSKRKSPALSIGPATKWQAVTAVLKDEAERLGQLPQPLLATAAEGTLALWAMNGIVFSVAQQSGDIAVVTLTPPAPTGLPRAPKASFAAGSSSEQPSKKPAGGSLSNSSNPAIGGTLTYTDAASATAPSPFHTGGSRRPSPEHTAAPDPPPPPPQAGLPRVTLSADFDDCMDAPDDDGDNDGGRQQKGTSEPLDAGHSGLPCPSALAPPEGEGDDDGMSTLAFLQRDGFAAATTTSGQSAAGQTVTDATSPVMLAPREHPSDSLFALGPTTLIQAARPPIGYTIGAEPSSTSAPAASGVVVDDGDDDGEDSAPWGNTALPPPQQPDEEAEEATVIRGAGTAFGRPGSLQLPSPPEPSDTEGSMGLPGTATDTVVYTSFDGGDGASSQPAAGHRTEAAPPRPLATTSSDAGADTDYAGDTFESPAESATHLHAQMEAQFAAAKATQQGKKPDGVQQAPPVVLSSDGPDGQQDEDDDDDDNDDAVEPDSTPPIDDDEPTDAPDDDEDAAPSDPFFPCHVKKNRIGDSAHSPLQQSGPASATKKTGAQHFDPFEDAEQSRPRGLWEDEDPFDGATFPEVDATTNAPPAPPPPPPQAASPSSSSLAGGRSAMAAGAWGAAKPGGGGAAKKSSTSPSPPPRPSGMKLSFAEMLRAEVQRPTTTQSQSSAKTPEEGEETDVSSTSGVTDTLTEEATPAGATTPEPPGTSLDADDDMTPPATPPLGSAASSVSSRQAGQQQASKAKASKPKKKKGRR